MTISRPRAGRNCQFEREPTPSPKTLKYGETVDALKPGAAPRAGAKTESPSGRFAAFSGPVFVPPDYGHARGRNRAPNAAIRPCSAISRSPDIPPIRRARNPARTRRPARPGQTPLEHAQPPPTQHPEPAPKREKAPAAARAAQRGPESRESRKVESRFAKVESRKSKVGKSIGKVVNRPKSRESRLFSQSRKS